MNTSVLNVWLDCLAALFAPKGVLLIGAGNGNGPLARWLLRTKPGHVIMVEGDEIRFRVLERNLESIQGFRLSRCVITPDSTPIPFNAFSHPDENGLMTEEMLKIMWPGIRQVNRPDPVKSYSYLSIPELLSREGGNVNWLIVDCLPSVELLGDIGSYYQNLDVIALRMVQNHSNALQAKQQETRILLENKGFRFVHQESERNPHFALALYIKKMDESVAQTTHEIDTLKQELVVQRKSTEVLLEDLGKVEQQIAFALDVMAGAPHRK